MGITRAPGGRGGRTDDDSQHEQRVNSDIPGVSIRPATRADLQGIGRIGAILARAHHDFDPQRFVAATARTEDEYVAYVGARLDEADVIVLVAERDGEVLGFSYAGLEPADFGSLRGPVGALYDIAVDPVSRGYGVGQCLLDATLAQLAARGAPRVLLSTAEQNTVAQRLFARAGFRRTMIEMTRELGGDAGG